MVAVVPWRDITAPTTVYATGKGERRTVTLADGTRIDLNAGSKISVKLGSRERRVVMEDAEAVFDVTKDPKRPFVIASGDRTVRSWALSSTSAAATAASRSPWPAASWRCGPPPALRTGHPADPGLRLDHVEGAAHSELSKVTPQEVFDWRTGRLVYRNRPWRRWWRTSTAIPRRR
uniref:FecR domain-containing protein n=1 Tax=Phenylobacterium glaciei TaxID=2803784 RepID=A0A974P187_9CAUL|nr:FecR domain-containing protein [Phenylobacterium glaciei]